MNQNTMINLAKKILILLVFCFMLTACSEKNETDENKLENYIEVIDEVEYKNLIEQNKFVIIYIGRPTCKDCQLFEERFIEDVKNNEYYSNIKYYNVEEIHKNKVKWEELKKENNINGTPAFVIFQNGKVIDSFSWNEDTGFDYKKFIDWIKKWIK